MFIRTSDFGLQTSEVLSQKSDVLTFERRLYIIRRQIEKATTKTYICSCSSKTIVYKGLLLATQIERFYPDLSDPDFISPFAIVHQRYSTNTFPSWELAHPFRAIAHNGEINALKGNLNALAAREESLVSPLFGDELKKLLPVVHGGQSDSASLDNVFELLVAAGRDAPHAMMMLIPQAWGTKYHVGHDVRAFYEYHSALMEPWDGPAAVCFTDGTGLGAALDRNGLRPARWTLTKSGLFVLASETGVLDIASEDVERHGRLRPGSLLWLDLVNHRLMENTELKTYYARRKPYRRWVKENHIPVTGLFTEIVPSTITGGENERIALQRDRARLGWTLEDVELIVRPMAETGHEPVGAMGNDAALACLSGKRRSLFDFFHQLFAQVTNPPIDPIREELVMSIMTYIGNKSNILDETAEHARLVKMTRPVLTDDELNRLKNVPDFPAVTLSLNYDGTLKAALDKLAKDALETAKNGASILVLSDRDEPRLESHVSRPNCTIPSLHGRRARRQERRRIFLELRLGRVQGHHEDHVQDGHLDPALLPFGEDLRGGRTRPEPHARLLPRRGLAHRRTGAGRYRKPRRRGSGEPGFPRLLPPRWSIPFPQGRGGASLESATSYRLPRGRAPQRLRPFQEIHRRHRPAQPRHITLAAGVRAGRVALLRDRKFGGCAGARPSRRGGCRLHRQALRRRRDVARLPLA